MAILDTDILIALGYRDQAALAKMKELEDWGEPVVTTHFSEFELFKGVFGSQKYEESLVQVSSLLKDLPRVPFEENAAQIAARIWCELKRRGAIIGGVDIFIASIVMAGYDTLITRNKKHFEKIPGLQIEEW